MEYFGTELIKKDLKRIKYRGVGEDVENHYKILKGSITEHGCVNTRSLPNGGDFLFCIVVPGTGEFNCFKVRQGIRSNPKLGTSKGLRIIYGVDEQFKCYVPLLVFTASEEQTKYHAPDGIDYHLTKSHFKQIVGAKLENM